MRNIAVICSIRDVPGPFFSLNGQSIITSCAYSFLVSRFCVTPLLHRRSFRNQILFAIGAIPYLVYLSLVKPFHFSYIVISRSPFGFLRDSIFILLLSLFNTRTLIHFHGRTLPKSISNVSLYLMALPLFRSCIHLILPSRSFFDNNPEWNVLSHTVISNFSQPLPPNNQVVPYINDDLDLVSTMYYGDRVNVRLTWNSNLIYSKGIVLLMEAINIFNNTSPTHVITLHVFGDYISDEYCSADELRSKVNLLSRRIPCILYGPVERSVTINSLTLSDFYVFPSFYSSEYQPLSLIDAMSAGLPVLSSSLSVLCSLLDGYPSSYFLPSKITPFNLAKAFSVLINCRKLDTKGMTYSKITSPFSRESFLGSFAELIESI